MKRVKCPECGTPITFDEKKYSLGKALIFTCPHCAKRFGIRLKKKTPANNNVNTETPENLSEFDKTIVTDTSVNTKANNAVSQNDTATDNMPFVGEILVIENVFHYKQILPLHIGDNTIGRYTKGITLDCPIHTDDPSIDITHCCINVSRDKKGNLKYILRDGPSNTGTFVDNTILGDRERRVIDNGTLFTIGATSILLRTEKETESES